MLYVLAASVGLLFGGAVEQLGGLPFAPWAWTTSQLSAPWLLLPFAFGTAAQRAAKAAALGLTVTLCGLVGYVLMLSGAAGHSPHGLTPSVVLHEARTQAPWFVAGSVSGPLYGVLGQRWRCFRWWPSALLAAGALALEPVALVAVGRTFGPSQVYIAESAAGLALGAWFVTCTRRRVRAARTPTQADVG
ncbi:MAG: hypothetical protein K6V97_14710 [Actinomycetia bacterium]|nr:hypothetical protein [Actinomycetes bacterium]